MSILTGFVESYLSKIEKGKRVSSLTALLLIAEALNTLPSELLRIGEDAGGLKKRRKSEYIKIRLKDLKQIFKEMEARILALHAD